jgi:hypothetical protein
LRYLISRLDARRMVQRPAKLEVPPVAVVKQIDWNADRYWTTFN